MASAILIVFTASSILGCTPNADKAAVLARLDSGDWKTRAKSAQDLELAAGSGLTAEQRAKLEYCFLHDDYRFVRQPAGRALAKSGRDGQGVLERCTTQRHCNRVEAVISLGYGGAEAVPALVRCLKMVDLEEVVPVALLRIGTTDAVSAALSLEYAHYWAAYPPHEDAAVIAHNVVRKCLTGSGYAMNKSGLLSACQDEDAAVRHIAVWAMRFSRDDGTLRQFGGISEYRQWMGEWILQGYNAPECYRAVLLTILRRDDSARVRLEAAHALFINREWKSDIVLDAVKSIASQSEDLIARRRAVMLLPRPAQERAVQE